MNINIFKSIVYSVLSFFGLFLLFPLGTFFSDVFGDIFLFTLPIFLIVSLVFYSHYEAQDRFSELNKKIDDLNNELKEIKLNNK